MAEILGGLYFREMRYDPKQPDWLDRDRFVLSKGHGCPALYAAFADAGIISKELLPTLHQIDSPLQMHPEIEDPRNFGSILRVADAGGVHGVVIQSHRSASLTPEAVKASAGASEHVVISMVPNIKHAISSLKKSGVTIVGAEAEGDKSIWDIDFTGSIALVVGSEAEGMRRTVKDHCDCIIKLPMRER